MAKESPPVYRTGHYGVSLLAYAPVAVALVATGHAGLAPLGGIGVLFLTPVPDWDHRIPFFEHRGITHTVWFALLVGTLLGASCFQGARVVTGLQAAHGSPELLGGFGFGVGTFAVLSHLAGDVITPAGLEPFHPVSGRHYTLDLVGAANRIANAALLVLGVFAIAVATLVSLRIG
jgi:inner membrane protein